MKENVRVTAFGREVAITKDMAEVLSDWQEADWSTVRRMVCFIDTILTSLSMSHDYVPSETGLSRAISTAAGMKDYFNKMIGNNEYEEFH